MSARRKAYHHAGGFDHFIWCPLGCQDNKCWRHFLVVCIEGEPGYVKTGTTFHTEGAARDYAKACNDAENLTPEEAAVIVATTMRGPAKD